MLLNRLLRKIHKREEAEEKERETRERQEEVDRIQQELHDAAARVHYIEITRQVLERARREQGGT